MKTQAILISVDGDYRGPVEVKIGSWTIGYRSYDGSETEEIIDEVSAALADLLFERLSREHSNWSKEDPDKDTYDGF